MATQIFCFSNGNSSIIKELFWTYKGKEDLEEIIESSNRDIFYVVSLKPKTLVRPKNTERILKDVEKIEVLQKLSLEEDIDNLRSVKVEKYIRVQAK